MLISYQRGFLEPRLVNDVDNEDDNNDDDDDVDDDGDDGDDDDDNTTAIDSGRFIIIT